MKLWLNGDLIDETAAHISPLDHGFTVGDGAFESLITYEGVPFAFSRHVKRLAFSCEKLGIRSPEQSVLHEACRLVISANQLSTARLRITVTSGIGPLGSDKGESQPTIVVAASEIPIRGPVAHVTVVSHRRNEHSALKGVKCTSYAENVMALAHAKLRNCSEAIFANTRRELCEGTGSNVFLVKNERIHTPALDSGCLAGVTRSIVLDLCHALGLPVDQTPLSVNALADADEAFLTSTFREVQPIASVDGRPLPAAPGPLTQRLRDAFHAFAQNNPDPDPETYVL